MAQQKEILIKINVDDKSLEQLTGELQQAGAEIKEVNELGKGLNIDQKFMAADGAIKAFAGSVEAAVGAIGLLGIESKVFEEYERYALAAISFGRGIFDLSEGMQKLKESTILAEIATTKFSKATRTALIATGIGAFIAGLATVVAYWDEITDYVNNLGKKSIKEVNEELELTKTQSDDIITLLESQVGLENAKGTSTLETNKKLLQQLQLQIDITDEQIKQKQIELAAETDERKRFSNWEAFIASLKSFGNIKRLAQEFNKEVNTETEKEIELQKELNGLLTDKNKILTKYTNLSKTVATQMEMEAGGAEKVATSTRGIVTVGETLENQLKANVGAFDENAQAQVKSIAANNLNKATIQANKTAEEQRQEGIYSSIEAITQLSAVLGQESAAAKALAISTALINTYVGVTEVLKQESTLSSPFDVIVKIANAATILAAGLGAVKNIKATPAKGGGGIPGGGVGPRTATGTFQAGTLPAINPGMFDVPQQMRAPQMCDTPVRAYVLAQDVQSGTEARDRLSLRRNVT